jgi:hypothetical protein
MPALGWRPHIESTQEQLGFTQSKADMSGEANDRQSPQYLIIIPAPAVHSRGFGE